MTLLELDPRDPIIIINSSDSDKPTLIKLINLKTNIDTKRVARALIDKFDILKQHKKELISIIDKLRQRISEPNLNIKDLSIADQDIEKYFDMLYDEEIKIVDCLNEMKDKIEDQKFLQIILKTDHLMKILLKHFVDSKLHISSLITEIFTVVFLDTNIQTDYDYRPIIGSVVNLFDIYSNSELTKPESILLVSKLLKLLSNITYSPKLRTNIIDGEGDNERFFTNLLLLLQNHKIQKIDLIAILVNLSVEDVIINFMVKHNFCLIFYQFLDQEEIYVEEIVDETLGNVLSLLLNMSLQPILRSTMITTGYINKLHKLFVISKLNRLARIIYTLSTDQHQINHFLGTKIITKLLQGTSQCCKNQKSWNKNVVLFETIVPAFFVNYTTCYARCEDLFAPLTNKNYVDIIMDRIFTAYNSPLDKTPTSSPSSSSFSIWFKVFKNVSTHAKLRSHFHPYINDILRTLQNMMEQIYDAPSNLIIDDSSPEITCVIEIMGFVCNLTHDEQSYRQISTYFQGNEQIISQFIRILSSNNDQVDLDLLVYQTLICFNDLIAANEDVAVDFNKHRLLDVLAELMKSKQEDDEFVCQLMYAFYRLLNYHPILNEIINHESVIPIVIDLMNDKNPLIRQICSVSLGIIAESDSENWGSVIQEEMFIRHNAFWLEMVNETLPQYP